MSSLRLILYFVFCLFWGTFAWTNDSDSTPAKMAIGIHFTPVNTYRLLTVDTSVQFMDYYKSSRDMYESAKLGFQLSLDFRYSFRNFFALQTGFMYTENGYQMRNRSWWDDSGIQQMGTADIKYRLRFISIPLIVTFSKNKGAFNLFFSGGISAQYLAQNSIKAEITYYDYVTSKTDETVIIKRQNEPVLWNMPVWELRKSRLNLSFICAFGIEAYLTKNISVKIGPQFHYSLLSVFEKPITENLYGTGVIFGFNYSF